MRLPLNERFSDALISYWPASHPFPQFTGNSAMAYEEAVAPGLNTVFSSPDLAQRFLLSARAAWTCVFVAECSSRRGLRYCRGWSGDVAVVRRPLRLHLHCSDVSHDDARQRKAFLASWSALSLFRATPFAHERTTLLG